MIKTHSATPAFRADALDALRGLAILAMVFSGTIRYKILPAWMYHAQEPPPTHTFNKAIAGLTWVDLVFPLFLFAMGAAIPLALSRRLAQGWTLPRVMLHVLKRGLLLGAFAIVLQHLRPTTIDADPSRRTWGLALIGFGLLFLMFGRWTRLSQRYQMALAVVGWVIAIAIIAQLPYGGKGFSLERSDPILLALANMSVFGSLVWLLTRSQPILRVGLLGYLLALQLAAGTPGWVKGLWDSSPVPWLFQFYYLKYLFIVIPGTIAGDLILKRMQAGDRPESEPSPAHRNALMRILVLLLLCFVLLVGLQGRWVWQTTVGCAGICAASWRLFVGSRTQFSQTETLIQPLYQWGVYWLFLGLCIEPFQGGIHKDPSTYSYYFVATAIALFLLILFTILIEFNQKKWLQLLIDNGQNPMIAYVAFANLIWPILQLSGVEDWIIAYTGTPAMGVLKGVLYTAPIALLTSFFTHRKLFWRA